MNSRVKDFGALAICSALFFLTVPIGAATTVDADSSANRLVVNPFVGMRFTKDQLSPVLAIRDATGVEVAHGEERDVFSPLLGVGILSYSAKTDRWVGFESGLWYSNSYDSVVEYQEVGAFLGGVAGHRGTFISVRAYFSGSTIRYDEHQVPTDADFFGRRSCYAFGIGMAGSGSLRVEAAYENAGAQNHSISLEEGWSSNVRSNSGWRLSVCVEIWFGAIADGSRSRRESASDLR